MSMEYEEYVREHCWNVRTAFMFLDNHFPEKTKVDPKTWSDIAHNCMWSHDKSKYSDEEYDAYDAYFYGEKTPEVEEAFNKAWLHHIHNNPHHWQHWVLINDDPELGEIVLDMPYANIIEMICDWWSFSWKAGNLYEIFDWYEKKKDYMKLSKNTRTTVEEMLSLIREKLDQLKSEGKLDEI